MVVQYLRCYVKYQQTNWAKLLPFAKMAYNSVYSSTGFIPFKATTGVEFVALSEFPQGTLSSVTLVEWMDSFRGTWALVHKALGKAREAHKIQADLKRASKRVKDGRYNVPVHKVFKSQTSL